jgi:hypothetical protein
MKFITLAIVLAVYCSCVQRTFGKSKNKSENKPSEKPVSRFIGEKGQGYELATSPTPETEERMRWFKEAKLGMFIHWGIY